MQKVLKNVFISTRFNKMQLVDVLFNETIQKIEPIFNKEIDWEEISSYDKLSKFTESFEVKEYEDCTVYDGNYKLLIPGCIDPHVHFNTPGFEYRDDFESASKSAAIGGTTTVFDMPCTSIPPVTTKDNFSTKLKAVADNAYIDYKFWGGISGKAFGNIDKLRRNVSALSELGVPGFKVYTISGMESFPDLTYEQIKIAAEIVKENNSILAVHAEDKKLVSDRETSARLNSKNDWGAYCGARDDQAEAKAVYNVIRIAAETGCPVHIVHLSSELALGLVRKAKSQGIPVTTETCPHYLQFTQIDFDEFEIPELLKTAPPIKFEYDRDALWEGIKDGSISFVSTDHAGCDPLKEKSSDNFWEVYGGIPGVQHRVNYLFSEGFIKGKLDLQTTIIQLSSNVKDVFNLNKKGKLQKDFDADMVLIDLWNQNTIDAKKMLCKGKYTPLNGLKLDTSVSEVFIRGNQIVKSEEISLKENLGKLLNN